MHNAARARQRVLALFLPVAAVLYVSAGALNRLGAPPASHNRSRPPYPSAAFGHSRPGRKGHPGGFSATKSGKVIML